MIYLSDPGPIKVYPCQWLTDWLTNWRPCWPRYADYTEYAEYAEYASFSRLFHEILHDGTTSDAQHYELNRSRPVDKLKTRYFVTLDMMGTNFATLHKRECSCHQNRKVANCFGWIRVCLESCSQIKSIVFIDSNEKHGSTVVPFWTLENEL